MPAKAPKTPFSTYLSGNAKETQLRIRSIFQWKKQRPPFWLLILVIMLALGCGGLVSCQSGQENVQAALPERTLEDGTCIYAKLQKPEVAEEAIDDTVTALYFKTPDGPEQLLGQFPFGPDHHYWESLSLKEFHNVLGGSGVVVGYQMGSASYVQEYHAIDSQGSKLLVAAQNTAYEVDVNGDGQKELITNYGALRYLDVFQVLDGKVNCCQVNELVRDDLGLDEHTWVGLYYYEDTGSVTATWTNPNGTEENRPLEIADLFAVANEHYESGINNEIRIERDELTGLTLDETGEGDDNAYLESRIPKNYDMDACEVELRVVLGTGEELTRTWNERAFPGLISARLTDPDRESIVVGLADMTSTYGAENTYVLDVVNGQLVERLKYSGVSGSYIQSQADAPLDTLRLAQLVDKWHLPEYHTALWDGEKFSTERDGFLVDEYPLGNAYWVNGEEVELTLSPRCITTESPMIYDRVQIMNGEEVFQTIDPADYLIDHNGYNGFLAQSRWIMYPLDVRDITFDGYPDFGILCDETRNNNHAWFVWDADKCEFTYLAHLGGDLTVVNTFCQLRVVAWEENSDAKITNFYSISPEGKLIRSSEAG